MKIEEVERAIKKQFEMKDSFKRKLNYWLVQGGTALSPHGLHAKSVLEHVFWKMIFFSIVENFRKFFVFLVNFIFLKILINFLILICMRKMSCSCQCDLSDNSSPPPGCQRDTTISPTYKLYVSQYQSGRSEGFKLDRSK